MAAVDIVNGSLVFGKENRGVIEANMTVAKGNIYGLLGPSGCGKTTLLNIVVGLKTIQSGTVSVFGHPLHFKDADVPGPWIGYMPQELCLHEELTAEETLRFFGLLHCLPRVALQERVQFLISLLEIPSNQLAGTMSSGQRRRLSLAVAMVHDPPLLVLDEPTVGVDPLLRMVIWKHLLELANGQGKTVLLTTHYIGEASSAHVVGFMREGIILKQENPEEAMKEYQSRTLDDVFLKVCESLEPKETDQDEHARSHFSCHPVCQDNSKVAKKLYCSLDAPGCSGKPSDMTGGAKTHRQKQISTGSISLVMSSSTAHHSEQGIDNPCFSAAVVDQGAEPLSTQETCIKPKTFDQKKLTSDATYLTTPGQLSASVSQPKMPWKKNFNKIFAITWKNWLITRRNIVLLVVTFLIPISNVMMVKLFLYKDPYGIPVAVVNEDHSSVLSEQLIRELDRTTLDIRLVDDLDEAKAHQEQLRVKSIVHIRPEFSINVIRKYAEYINSKVLYYEGLLTVSSSPIMFDVGNHFVYSLSDCEFAFDSALCVKVLLEHHASHFTTRRGLKCDNSTVLKSFVHLYTDGSNKEVDRTVFNSLLKSYARFGERYAESLGADRRTSLLPLTIEKPVLGEEKSDRSDYAVMNMLPESLFIMSLCFTVFLFMADTTTGIHDRMYVAGVTNFQMITSHFLISGFISTVQIIFLVVFLKVYKLDTKGSFILFCFLLYQAAYLGVALGVLLAALNNKTSTALLAVISIGWSTVGLTGLMSSLECLSPGVREMVKFLPRPWLYRAVRRVRFHGLGLDNPIIWESVLLTAVWTLGFLSASLLVMRWKNWDTIYRRMKKTSLFHRPS